MPAIAKKQGRKQRISPKPPVSKGAKNKQTFHVFFALGKNSKLTYAYEATLKEIFSAITDDPPRPKNKCPALVLNKFNPLGETIRNQYILLNHTTGYFGIDVDSIGGTVNFVKNELFACATELLCVWVSSSGKGVKAIGYSGKLKNLTPEAYKKAYDRICDDIKKRVGMRINFDKAMGRCHQPIFLNNDKNALIR